MAQFEWFHRTWVRLKSTNQVKIKKIYFVIGYNAERMNFLHEDIGRDHVKVDVLEEAAQDLCQLGAVR